MLAFLTCFCGICRADEAVSEPKTDVVVFVEQPNSNLFDISLLHSYLSEKIQTLDKIIASFPKHMNRDQKSMYWMYSGLRQGYKETLVTIELLQHNQ
jgi:hypothetical protein